MDEVSPDLWDAPAERTLARYLATVEGDAERAAARAVLLAMLRAEPIARGCPTLAMITQLDLLDLRALVESQWGADAEAALDALEAFLSWARAAGAHALPAGVVAQSLRRLASS